MPKAVKTRFCEVYHQNKHGKLIPGLQIVKDNPLAAGVYLIKSKRTGDIVYIGFSSSQIYKTLYRHFESWNDSAQQRKVYSKTGYLVRVIFTTIQRAAILEKYLIQQIKPRDNANKYQMYLSELEQETAAQIENDSPFISINGDLPF